MYKNRDLGQLGGSYRNMGNIKILKLLRKELKKGEIYFFFFLQDEIFITVGPWLMKLYTTPPFPGVFPGFSWGFSGVFLWFSQDFFFVWEKSRNPSTLFSFFLFLEINYATSLKLYQSYYPHRSRDSLSPVCRIFFVLVLVYAHFKGFFCLF